MSKRPIASECLVCAEPCTENNSLICAENHVTCYACIREATKQWCAADGQFCLAFHARGQPTAAGEWPCVMFSSGQCSVGGLPPRVLERAIFDDPEAWSRYMASRECLAASRALNDVRSREEAERKEREKATALIRAYQDVLQAMREGQGVHCPTCHLHCQKDDHCIHMNCSQCKTQFCYWCGRRWGKCKCNRGGVFMEQRAGWSEYAREGETPARGALLEFHRRKIAVGVRTVKESMPMEIWQQLQVEYPDLLKNVLPGGRSIEWAQVDTAELPAASEDWTPTSAATTEGVVPDNPEQLEIYRQGQRANGYTPPPPETFPRFCCVRVHDTLDVPAAFRGQVGRVLAETNLHGLQIGFDEFYPEVVVMPEFRRNQLTPIADREAWEAVTPDPAPALPDGVSLNKLVHLRCEGLLDHGAAARLISYQWNNRYIVRVMGVGPHGVLRVQYPDYRHHMVVSGSTTDTEFGVPATLISAYPIDLEDTVGVLIRSGGNVYTVLTTDGYTIPMRRIGCDISTGSIKRLLEWEPRELSQALVSVNDAFPMNSMVRLMNKAKPQRKDGARRGPNVGAYQGQVGRVVGYEGRSIRLDFSEGCPKLTGRFLWPITTLIRHTDEDNTFPIGSRVLFSKDKEQLKKWAERHGAVKVGMFDALGKEGTVLGFHPSGDLNVQFTEPPVIWRLNREALIAV